VQVGRQGTARSLLRSVELAAQLIWRGSFTNFKFFILDSDLGEDIPFLVTITTSIVLPSDLSFSDRSVVHP